jgi:hypothetical protein
MDFNVVKTSQGISVPYFELFSRCGDNDRRPQI